MTKQPFDPGRLDDLLTYGSVVNITDPAPDEVCAFLHQTRENSLAVSSNEWIEDMIEAVRHNTMDSFREKYCEAPFLIVTVSEGDVSKEVFQEELVFVLSVRQYKKLPSVIVSTERLKCWPFPNIGLINYTHLHGSMRK